MQTSALMIGLDSWPFGWKIPFNCIVLYCTFWIDSTAHIISKRCKMYHSSDLFFFYIGFYQLYILAHIISKRFSFYIPSLKSFTRFYSFVMFLLLPSVSPRSAALCRSSECSWWWLGFPIIPSLRISSRVSCSSILLTCTDRQTDR